MKNRWFVLIGFVALSSFSGWFYASNFGEDLSNKNNKSVSKVKLKEASITQNRSLSSLRNQKVENLHSKNHSPYFKNLLEEDLAKVVYHRSLELLHASPKGEALARWITLGLRFDSSEEYGDDFRLSLNEINQHPEKTLEVISKVYKQLSLNNSDVFIQSMLLNVVHQLDISKEQKIDFYLERIGDKFELDQDGSPTQASLNITSSMAFLNQYEFEKENLKEKIEASLLEHKENKKTQQELGERFIAYFPEFKADIKIWIEN